jgi:hypothetical protein
MGMVKTVIPPTVSVNPDALTLAGYFKSFVLWK